MKTREYVRYPVIKAAKDGGVEAINVIVSHYKYYMKKLSVIKGRDDYGNEKRTVDIELYRTLQAHLVTAIMKFKIR